LELETHGDVPNEIRQQPYAEERQWLEKASKISSMESPLGPPININFLPTLSSTNHNGYTG
jgi:hypothetical protein